MRINEIKNPDFLKKLNHQQMGDLCDALRAFLLDNISQTGGHLASNLGIVEVSVELLKVFDGAKDKIIYDVGHQSYIHKILTGRADKMSTLRQYKGLSGFQKRHESIYDAYEAGHSSTSLSAALGMCIARDLKGEEYHVIAVIGDGAMGGGMALEALNHIGELKPNLTIVLNDNEMSISENVGGISHVLSHLRISNIYTTSKSDLKDVLMKSENGQKVLENLRKTRDVMKRKLIGDSIFTQFGIDYLGPINGHDVKALEKAFNTAKKHHGPLVVHVKTMKGKGYAFAENDKEGIWHGVGKFDVASGAFKSKTNPNRISYSELVTKTLINLKEINERIVVITPAMKAGSKLDAFFKKYPASSFDCGIAEEHAITLASGMAIGDLQPFVAIYSSFLQRAYDQINHDIARMNLPVVIGIDRSGIVGEDGETHHGLFDIGILKGIPNIIIAHPKNGYELQNMLYTAFIKRCPFVIRFPRGNTSNAIITDFQKIKIGTWTKEYTCDNTKLVIFTYSEYYFNLLEYISVNNLPITLINCRFIKPIDYAMLDEMSIIKKWLIVEETMRNGGINQDIKSYICDKNYDIDTKTIAIEDHFVTHGSVDLLRLEEHVAIDDIIKVIEECLNA